MKFREMGMDPHGSSHLWNTTEIHTDPGRWSINPIWRCKKHVKTSRFPGSRSQLRSSTLSMLHGVFAAWWRTCRMCWGPVAVIFYIGNLRTDRVYSHAIQLVKKKHEQTRSIFLGVWWRLWMAMAHLVRWFTHGKLFGYQRVAENQTGHRIWWGM